MNADEKALLESIMWEPGLLADKEIVADLFPSSDGKLLFSVLSSSHEKGLLLMDLIALSDNLRQAGMDEHSVGMLCSLLDPYTSANALFYRDRLINKRDRQQVLATLAQASQDLEDGINVGDVKGRLQKALDGMPARSIDVYRPVPIEEIRVSDMPPRPWSIDGMIPRGELTIIGAKKGIGKSWLCLQMAKSIASGTDFLGLRTEQGGVLYWPSEMDITSIHERSLRYGPLPEGFDVMLDYPPRGDALLKILPKLINQYAYSVVFLDMMQGFLPKTVDSNSYETGHDLLELRRISMKTECSIVGTWHLAKGDREDPVMGLIGSTAIGGQAGSIITLDRKRGCPDGKLNVVGNHGREHTIDYTFNEGLFTGRVGDDLSQDDVRIANLGNADHEVLLALRSRGEGIAVTALAASMGKAADPTRAALNRLSRKGFAEKRSGNWYPVCAGLPNGAECSPELLLGGDG